MLPVIHLLNLQSWKFYTLPVLYKKFYRHKIAFFHNIRPADSLETQLLTGVVSWTQILKKYDFRAVYADWHFVTQYGERIKILRERFNEWIESKNASKSKSSYFQNQTLRRFFMVQTFSWNYSFWDLVLTKAQILEPELGSSAVMDGACMTPAPPKLKLKFLWPRCSTHSGTWRFRRHQYSTNLLTGSGNQCW